MSFTFKDVAWTRPAIIVSLLTASFDDTDRTGPTPYTTAAVALTGGSLHILAQVWQRNSGDAPAAGCTQTGATWTQIRTSIWSGSDARMSIWRCQPASNVSAATIAMGPTAATGNLWCHWSLLRFDNVFQDTANNGAGCILQTAAHADNPASGTTLTASVASAVSAPNIKYGCFFGLSNSSNTETGVDQISETVGAVPTVMSTAIRLGSGDTTITSTLPNATPGRGAIGLEIRAVS